MRRLNVKLVIWLVLGTIAAAGGTFGLNRWQVRGNVTSIMADAERKLAGGNDREAAKALSKALKQQKSAEKYQQLAEIYKRIYKDMKSREELSAVYNDLERGLNNFPDMQDVRKFAIEFNLAIGQPIVALSHIKMLKETDVTTDVQTAEALLGTKQFKDATPMLEKLLGYDEKEGKFAGEAPGAKIPRAYSLLVQALILGRGSAENNSSLIDRTMAQLLTTNPDNGDAYREHGRCLLMVGARKSGTSLRDVFKSADEDFQKALQLNPNDELALRSAVDTAGRLGDQKRADALLTDAMKRFPAKEIFHTGYAQAAIVQRNWDEAERRILKSLEVFPENMDLKGQLAMVKMNQKKFKEMEEILSKLETAHFNPMLILRVRADADYVQKQYVKATKKYEELRVAVLAASSRQDQPTDVDLKLADCYVNLGEYDLAVPLARKTLNFDADNLLARIIMQQCRRFVGATLTEASPLTSKEMASLPDLTGTRTLQERIAEQMSKADPADRDFTAAEQELQKYFDDQKVSEGQQLAKRAQLKMLKGEQEDARKMLLAGQKQFPKEDLIWNSLFLMAMAERKYDDARSILTQAQEPGAESLTWRLSRLQLSPTEGIDGIKKALTEVEVGADKMSEEERTRFYQTIGEYYRQLNDADNAKRCWREYAKLMPVNAMVRKELFDLALVSRDQPEMTRVTTEIGDLLGKDSALHKYCEMAQILTNVADGKVDSKEALKNVDKLLEEARRTRPDWGELSRMAAWTYELRGNPTEAIESYKQAITRGSAAGVTVRRLLYLMTQLNRYSEAYDYLAYLPDADARDQVQRLVVDILLRTEHNDEAAKRASIVAERAPTAENFCWFASILKRVGRQQDATNVLQKAVETSPSLAGAWVMLVSHLANDQPNKTESERLENAQIAVRRAKEAITGKDAALAFAEMHELIGDLDQAEEYFKQYSQEQPDSLVMMDRLARFFLKRNKTVNAEIWLDKLLESKEADRATKANARRIKAVLMTASGKYEDFRKACDMISENRDPVGDTLQLDDMAVLARLHSRRSEPMLVSKGVAYLEKIQKTAGLTIDDHLMLAMGLETTGQHKKAIDQMTNLVGRDEKNSHYVASLIKLMLDNYDEKNPADVEIERWLTRLQELDPKDPDIGELQAWFYTLKGDKDKALELLAQNTPKPPYTAKSAPAMLASARRYEVLKFYTDANDLYRACYKVDPRANLPLGQFLALHGDMDEAFNFLDQSRNAHAAFYVIQAAMRALHDRPKSDIKPEYFTRLEGWVREAMTQDDPVEQKNGFVQLAEIRDMQNKYAEAAKFYRDFLAKPDLNDLERGLSQNNLAFLISVKPELANAPGEAKQLIADAMKSLGESSDLMDTLAMVLLSEGDLKEAKQYSQKAADESPTALKFLHLAVIESKLGNYTAANAANRTAKNLKVKPGDISPLEQPLIDEMLKKIGG
jgi:Tfp pilus assembly protein PilF